MEQNIKALGELDKLLSESTSQTVLKPDLSKFKRISEIINSKTNIPKEFMKLLKTKIMSLKHPRSQLLLFELIEFTTCKCAGPMHTEYNNKDFLQTMNSIFNQKQLSDEVRNKLLSLIQFWNIMFESRKDIYQNFSWYYNLILSRGIPFPPFKQSPYLEGKSLQGQGQNQGQGQGGNQPGQTQPTQTGFESMPSNFTPPGKNDDIFETMSEKQKKLFQDLSVVLENVQLANSMMDENERDMEEVISSIQKMEKKLQSLPEKLMQANEGFLHAYCFAILEDTSFTLNRYSRYVQRQPTPRFASNAEQIIEQARQMFSQQAKPTPVENQGFDSKPQQPQNNSFDAQFGGLQQNQSDFGFGGQSVQNQPVQNQQSSFGSQQQTAFGGQVQPQQNYGGQQQNTNFGGQPAPQDFGFQNAQGQNEDFGSHDNGFGFQGHQNQNQNQAQSQSGDNQFGNATDYGFGGDHQGQTSNQGQNQHQGTEQQAQHNFGVGDFGNFQDPNVQFGGHGQEGQQETPKQENPFGAPSNFDFTKNQQDHFRNF